MYHHEPLNYECPFCLVGSGKGDNLTPPSNIVYRDELLTVFISPKWWINNPGHAIIIPNEHHENLYTTPDELLAKLHIQTKRVAVAMRQAYECTGVSIRQHNEPDGGQDVWHFHIHVFPRHEGDKLYENDRQTHLASDSEKNKYAAKLRAALLHI